MFKFALTAAAAVNCAAVAGTSYSWAVPNPSTGQNGILAIYDFDDDHLIDAITVNGNLVPYDVITGEHHSIHADTVEQIWREYERKVASGDLYYQVPDSNYYIDPLLYNMPSWNLDPQSEAACRLLMRREQVNEAIQNPPVLPAEFCFDVVVPEGCIDNFQRAYSYRTADGEMKSFRDVEWTLEVHCDGSYSGRFSCVYGLVDGPTPSIPGDPGNDWGDDWLWNEDLERYEPREYFAPSHLAGKEFHIDCNDMGQCNWPRKLGSGHYDKRGLLRFPRWTRPSYTPGMNPCLTPREAYDPAILEEAYRCRPEWQTDDRAVEFWLDYPEFRPSHTIPIPASIKDWGGIGSDYLKFTPDDLCEDDQFELCPGAIPPNGIEDAPPFFKLP